MRGSISSDFDIDKIRYGAYIDERRYINQTRSQGGTTMNQSFGSWMLTGGIRGELHEDARHLEHVRAIRELRSERATARRAARSAAFTAALTSLRARFAGEPAAIAPDCCPA
jgi:hypothetical protein